MITREFFGKRTIVCNNGDPANLLYYLVQESVEGCMSYGVEIIMLREGRRESALAGNVTTSRLSMTDMVRRLADNTVTPCTLQEVIWEERHKA